MTPTENLKKHMEDIEQRRLTLYFHMQKMATDLSDHLYIILITIIVIAVSIILVNTFLSDKDPFLIMWSSIFAVSAMIMALLQYMHILEKISVRNYAHASTIYKGYDDEYYILKKYNIGELDQNMIRQFYVNKTRDAERYISSIITPGWFTWYAVASLIGAVILVVLA